MNNQRVHSILNNKVSAINNKLNNISSGGCGLFALEMYKALKNIGVNCSVVLVNASNSIEQVDTLIEGTGKRGINSAYQYLFKDPDCRNMLNGHICVKFEGKLYDNEGQYHGQAISKHITIKTMEKFLTMDCWNSTFKDDNEHNDNIIGTIEDFFEKLFNRYLTAH